MQSGNFNQHYGVYFFRHANLYYVINVILNSIFLSSNAELIPCKFDCAWPRHALLIVIVIKAIVLNLYLFLECFPFKADFQSSHEAPRSSLRVLASN